MDIIEQSMSGLKDLIKNSTAMSDGQRQDLLTKLETKENLEGVILEFTDIINTAKSNLEAEEVAAIKEMDDAEAEFNQVLAEAEVEMDQITKDTSATLDAIRAEELKEEIAQAAG